MLTKLVNLLNMWSLARILKDRYYIINVGLISILITLEAKERRKDIGLAPKF